MTKHYKWTPDWEKKTIGMIGKEETKDKLFKKGEKKPDGTEVTKDEGETIKVKVNEVKELFKEIKDQKQVAKDKLKAFNDKTGKGEELAQVYQEYDELERQLGDATNGWNVPANKAAYVKRYQDFIKDAYGSGSVHGWTDIQKEYIEKKFKDATGTVNQPYSNLYEFSTWTEKDFNKASYWKTTEQEVIKLITRTIKELQKIKKTEFDTFINSASDCVLPTNTAQFPTSTFSRAHIIDWMDEVRNIKLVDNCLEGTTNPANGKRIEYSFGQDYTTFGTEGATATAIDTNRFTDAELTNLFNLTKVLGTQIYEWGSKDKFKEATADIKDDALIVLPAKTEPVAEDKLKDWGLTGYTVDPTTKKTNYYLTDYGTQISSWEKDLKPVEYSWDTKKELKVEEGISGWIKLINHLRSKGYDNENERKLISSFTADPISQLFQDTRTEDEFGRFGTTQQYTLNEFPKYLALKEKRFYELKAKKKSLLKTAGTDQEEINKLEQEYQTARTELKAKEDKLEARITERKDWYRTELKKFGVEATAYKGFAKTATEDNRIEISDLGKLQHWLKSIRYLENGSEDENSSIPNENTALTDLENLQKKLFQSNRDGTKEEKCIHYTMWFIQNGKQKVEDKIKYTEESYINKPWQIHSWQDIIDGFEEIEKLVKIPAYYNEYKEAVKAHMNKEENEKLSDWQTQLKALDPILTDAVITEAKMKDFQKHNNFKKISEVKGLIQKVLDKDATDDTKFKVKADFIEILKKEEAEVDDLAKMFIKFDAEKIIKLIQLFEYEKTLTEGKKEEIRRKYSWDRRKKADDKYVEDNGDYTLSEEEVKLSGDFPKFLYELATGSKSLNLLSKPASEENQEDPNKKKEEQLDSWFKFGKGNVLKPCVTYLGGALIIVGITAIFWKQISQWWNGPGEEEVEVAVENTEGTNDSE